MLILKPLLPLDFVYLVYYTPVMSLKKFILLSLSLIGVLILLSFIWMWFFVSLQQNQLSKSRYDVTLSCQQIASQTTNPSWQYNGCLQELQNSLKSAGDSGRML